MEDMFWAGFWFFLGAVFAWWLIQAAIRWTPALLRGIANFRRACWRLLTYRSDGRIWWKPYW